LEEGGRKWKKDDVLLVVEGKKIEKEGSAVEEEEEEDELRDSIIITSHTHVVFVANDSLKLHTTKQNFVSPRKISQHNAPHTPQFCFLTSYNHTGIKKNIINYF
jgi:hypothetical protein